MKNRASVPEGTFPKWESSDSIGVNGIFNLPREAFSSYQSGLDERGGYLPGT